MGQSIFKGKDYFKLAWFPQLILLGNWIAVQMFNFCLFKTWYLNKRIKNIDLLDILILVISMISFDSFPKVTTYLLVIWWQSSFQWDFWTVCRHLQIQLNSCKIVCQWSNWILTWNQRHVHKIQFQSEVHPWEVNHHSFEQENSPHHLKKNSKISITYLPISYMISSMQSI